MHEAVFWPWYLHETRKFRKGSSNILNTTIPGPPLDRSYVSHMIGYELRTVGNSQVVMHKLRI